MKTEILAPAGSMESLISAVRCGANAVYLGSKQLSARRNASNFDNDELFEAVKYCHQRNVKVYLTLNTLVSDDEFKVAYNTVETAMLCGVDGFIVQDLGIAKNIKQWFPDAVLHASTQCSVMTADGFNALKKLGFSRVVLPREMSLEEILQIRKSTDLELEIFIHGALCMCVSGQCYLSAMLGSRSGNRGLCAQPCRLNFSADGTQSCDLSLKDLSLIKEIKKISDAGVISLKIEGRMKRPEYVAGTVTACKKALNGEYSDADEQTLKSVFSRSGFTDGYFTGKRQNMFGIRQKEDVVAANGVLKELSHLYDNENPLIPVDLKLTFKENQPSKLVAKTDYKTVEVIGEMPQRAINKPLSSENLSSRISKLGTTQYYPRKVDIDMDEGLIMPAGKINELRRLAVEKLNEIPEPKFTQKDFAPIKKAVKSSTPYYTARFANPNQIPQNHNFKRIFIPLDSPIEDFAKHNAGAEIPRGLFGMEDKLKIRLSQLKEAGVTNILCSNLGAYETAKSLGFTVYGDFGLNIFNSETANMFNSPILSFELTLDQANAINAPDTGIIGYGKLPLMLTRNCPIKNRIGCENCKKHGVLTDRKGYKFKVKCSNYPCVEILNPHPIYMGDRQKEIKTDFIHFYFTDEDKSQVSQVIDSFNSNKAFDKKFTRGLYYRGVM
jgi:putative protease